MAEKMTEAQAKTVYEAAKKAHEAAINILRMAQLEFKIALENLSNANDRFATASTVKLKSLSEVKYCDKVTEDAFMNLSKIQLETKGYVG